MKKLIIIIIVLINFNLNAEMKGNYIGGDLIYNNAALMDTDYKSSGYGLDLFYQSFISDVFSYKIIVGGIYNSFSSEVSDTVFNSLTSMYQPLDYTKDEKFFNLFCGLLFNYNFLFDKLFNIKQGNLSRISPYLSSGLIYSFIHKSLNYNYSGNPGSFIDTEERSRWLPASLGIPLSVGFNIKVSKKSVINFDFTYLLLIYDETSKNYGYEKFMNFKLGYMNSIDFKL